VTLTFATLEIDADSGYGEIETYSTVDTTSGDYIDGKAVPADDVATYHLNPGTYRAIVSEANEVSKEVSLTAGTTTPVTLTFATLEIDADSGYGEIETYSTVDTTSGDYIDGKSVPADGVATYHLDPGTYQAIVSEANEVSKEVALSAGVTTPVTLTFATLEIDAEVGNRQLESYSTVDTTDGEYVDGKTVPVDGVATYHLEPGTYRAIASEANEISREVSTVAGETRSVGMVFGLLNVSASAGTAYASVQDTNGNYIDGKSVPAAGGTDFHLNPATYQLEVTDDDTDASVSDAVSVSSSVQTFATAQFGTGAVDVRTEALAAANFTFSDLTLSATDLPAGASLSVSATITNTGDTPGEYTAPFKLDGAVVETQGGRLGVDEETTVTFSTVMDTDGVYDVTVGNLTARPVTVGDGSSGQQQPTVEPQFTSTPDSPSVTEAITFDATQTTVSDGTIESYEWDFTGDGTVDATGAVVTHTFEQAGSYTVSLTVSVADGSQNTTSESITVGDSQTVVRLDPTSRTTGVGGTATYDVVVEGYESGIESYQFDTSVGSADTATITAVSLRGTESSDSASAIEFASDNTSVSVSADGAGHDNGVIATVSVTGERAGTTDLTVHSPVVADSLGNTYDIETSENATLTVESVPAVVGDTPARDLNGDASYEDINGDGSFDVVDVNAFFNHYQSQSVQTNSDLFDFTGDGVVDVADVRHLFSVIQQ
jgi:PKD repeat protein